MCLSIEVVGYSLWGRERRLPHPREKMFVVNFTRASDVLLCLFLPGGIVPTYPGWKRG